MSIKFEKITNRALATYIFDGGNTSPVAFIRQRVFTIVTVLEPVCGVFPARLLPKTRAANQNIATKQMLYR